ncbi:hypothetical protein OG21DRAFT_849324 [Imleria badia]|nr:hypothetical protein OG21DRAFT_849324 [Imleria badia]
MCHGRSACISAGSRRTTLPRGRTPSDGNHSRTSLTVPSILCHVSRSPRPSRTPGQSISTWVSPGTYLRPRIHGIAAWVAQPGHSFETHIRAAVHLIHLRDASASTALSMAVCDVSGDVAETSEVARGAASASMRRPAKSCSMTEHKSTSNLPTRRSSS